MSGIGHVGEIDVIEYLTKQHKMDICLPFKDKGLGFIGLNNGNHFEFQVKTSKFQKGSYFWFDIYKSKMIYSDKTFYVFVCFTMPRRQFMQSKRNFFLVPSMQLKKWIDRKELSSKKGNDNCFNIFLYPNEKEKTWIYKNKGKYFDWTKYWNNFECLEYGTYDHN
ncbi:MAG: hypothetical protein V1747_03200 [Candidatus Omnitrophota bacterium]